MATFIYAMSALGETICVGCGDHFIPASHSRIPKVYCSIRCKARVSRAGGRYNRTDLRLAVEAIVRGERHIPRREHLLHA